VRPIRPIASDPAGNQKIDRAKAKEKVDGAVALAMGIGVAAGSGRQASVYEERPSFLTIGCVPGACIQIFGWHKFQASPWAAISHS
jgi:hypothetical protein